jgi:hypothetical protein
MFNDLPSLKGSYGPAGQCPKKLKMTKSQAVPPKFRQVLECGGSLLCEDAAEAIRTRPPERSAKEGALSPLSDAASASELHCVHAASTWQ